MSLCDWLKAISDWKLREQLAGVVAEETVESSRSIDGSRADALITGGIENGGEVRR